MATSTNASSTATAGDQSHHHHHHHHKNDANDVHVTELPDYTDEATMAFNEKKTWEELKRIKSLPVHMEQKRKLKGQLAKLPTLQLKGWRRLHFNAQKMYKNLKFILVHATSKLIFLNNSLRTIELRSGTAIVNVFLFIKWTLLLNLGMSAVLFTFIIGPYTTYNAAVGSSKKPTVDPATCSATAEGDDIQLNVTEQLLAFMDCCRAKYEYKLELLATGKENRGALNYLMIKLGAGSFEKWPVSISYYMDMHFTYDALGTSYAFDVAYVLVGVVIFAFCLVLLVKTIASGVKEIIHLREGEFYKYSNLVFSGWEHYTKDPKGAEFKRRVIKNEMKIALQTEKRKITDLLITKRQRAKIMIMRVFVNVLVITLILFAGLIIFFTTLALTTEGKDQTGTKDAALGMIPSLTISMFNTLFPIILARMGRLEKYSREWETALLLLRSLFIRLFSVYACCAVFYKYTYCVPKPGHCTKCVEPIVREGIDIPDRQMCWESLFADQVYRLIIIDLIVKILITFIVDPTRRMIGKIFDKNKLCRRLGTLSFNIVRHSLDVIYIQILSWMSFYFAPFAPILAVIYCLLLFYIKKFSVLYNCKSVPDTFRTTRSTGMFMAAKIISFVVVLFTFAFIVGFMVPSAECGPFRGKPSAWAAVSTELKETMPGVYEVLHKFGSPGIALPIALVLILLTYYYYSVAQANRAMVETLRHLLILEGHDKQYLFSKLNSLRRGKKQKRAAAKLGQPRGSIASGKK